MQVRGTDLHTVDTICVRKRDAALFEPSFDPDNVHAIFVDLFSGKSTFYFRRVVPVRHRRRALWRRTGEIWEPESGEFDVIVEAGEMFHPPLPPTRWQRARAWLAGWVA